MGLIKVFLIKLLVILSVISMVQTVCSETVNGPGISVTGTVLGLSQNFEWLTLFEKSIRLTSGTVFLDEDGNKMRVQDLKPGLLVTVEAVADAKGFLAKRIVIQKLRRE